MSLCVIDSGVGGFSVVRRLCALRHSSAPIFYCADWAYAPYGCKSLESIQHRIVTIANWLGEQGIQRIVLGCHTASYALLSVGHPLIETMIDATVRSIVCQKTVHGVVVLCTPLSFSHRHLLWDRIKKHNWDQPVYFVPCPYLAGFIEGQNWDAATHSVMNALATVPHAFDRVVYGCTHYALLHNRLPESMQAIMIDPADYYDIDGVNGHSCDTSKCASSSVADQVTTLFYTGSVPTESVRHYVHSACRFIPVPSSVWNTNESARAGCGPDQRSVECA